MKIKNIYIHISLLTSSLSLLGMTRTYYNLANVITSHPDTPEIYTAIQPFKHAVNDLHETFQGEETPLYYAIIYNNEHAVKSLIQYGANVNAPTYGGCRPIHAWTRARMFDKTLTTKHREILKLLLAHGADINAGTRSYHACHYGIKDSNKPTFGYGDTALHKAIYSHYTASLNLLLEHGANIEIRNKAGLSPIDLALRLNKTEHVKIIQERHWQENKLRKLWIAITATGRPLQDPTTTCTDLILYSPPANWNAPTKRARLK